MNPTNPPELIDGYAALPNWGLIEAQGEDAAVFLHSQLTQDVLHLNFDQARLAAYCNAKGRMLASFILCQPPRPAQSPPTIWLLCAKDILAPTLKRLQMFVLRAKVSLKDASDQWRMVAHMTGSMVTPKVAPTSTAISPASSQSAPDWRWHITALPLGLGIHLHASAGIARTLWIVPPEQAQDWLNTTQPPLDASLWDWLDICSGVAHIHAPLVEKFVPQMLNYDLIDGVNFKKGCYPGQEIVARSQYLGTLKRRTVLLHCNNQMHEEEEIFHETDPNQPCGMIVNSAACPNGGYDALVEIKVNHWVELSRSGLRLGSVQGPHVTALPQPYAVPELDNAANPPPPMS